MFGLFNPRRKLKRIYKAKSTIKFIIITPIIVTLGVAILYQITNSGDKDNLLNPSKSKDRHIVTMSRLDINPLNTDGSINGLNLLLISQMSDSYIKDYLQTLVDNQEGKLNSNAHHIAMKTALSIVMTEEGCYIESGNTIPLSYLPWDSESNSPLWNKSKSSIPAEALWLQQANRNVLGGSRGNGPIAACRQADKLVADWSNGGTYGPFQIALNEVDDSQKANINGYQSDGSRGFDWFYLPDNLSHLDHRLDITTDLVDYDSLSEDAQIIAYALQYNPGSGAMVNELGGTGKKTPERNANLEDLASDFEKVQEKFGPAIAQHEWSCPNAEYLAICIALCDAAGWQFTGFGGTLYNESYKVLFPNATDDVYSYLGAHSSGSGENAHAGLRSYPSFEKQGATPHKGDIISLGHAYIYAKMGEYFYARLLQMGGVAGVDPTNPATYTNHILQKSGGDEWVPDGTTDWLLEIGVDIKKIGPNRAKLLNTAHTQLGVPYVWGGTAWGSGMDCSGFVQQAIYKSFGVLVGRTTYAQAVDSNFVNINSLAEALPGDIIIISHPEEYGGYQHHVVFFLKDNGDGTIIALHEPRTGDVCKISSYNLNTTTAAEIRRFNQLEGPAPQ